MEIQIENEVRGILINCNKNGIREKTPMPAIRATEKKNPGLSRILNSESNPDPAAVCRKHSNRIIRISFIILEGIV